MKPDIKTIDDYINQLDSERKDPFMKLQKVIRENLIGTVSEELSYGMVGFVVPHSIYPNGYHCDPKLPLPFINLASQKNFISLYHMGLYADPEALTWFQKEYPKHCKHKLDMGKSCIRFKKMDDIPYELIGELVRKMTPEQWISMYEANVRR